MTKEEFDKAQATLNEVETVSAELRRKITEGIDAARTINANVRVQQAQLRQRDEQANALRDAVRAHLREEARLKAEADAAAKRKAAEDAAKVLPPAPSPPN